GRANSPPGPRRTAAAAATSCRSPVRCARSSVSAPTPGRLSTAAWSDSNPAAVRIRRPMSDGPITNPPRLWSTTIRANSSTRRAENPAVPDVPVAVGAELPALVRRCPDLQPRNVDAADGAGLDRPDHAHGQPRLGTGLHHGP